MQLCPLPQALIVKTGSMMCTSGDWQALECLHCCRQSVTQQFHTCAGGGQICDVALDSASIKNMDLAMPDAAIAASICSALKVGCCVVLEQRALLPGLLTVRVQRAVLCDDLRLLPEIRPGPVPDPAQACAAGMPALQQQPTLLHWQ